MEEPKEETGTSVTVLFRKWGLWAVLFGAAALILVFLQVFGPASEPTQSVGTQIGEIAGDIRRAAWRSFFGLSNEGAAVETAAASDYLALLAPVLGVVAVVLSLISVVLRENWRFALYGTGLGAAAIVFHFFWWVALVFAGALIIVAIIENIGDIFGS